MDLLLAFAAFVIGIVLDPHAAGLLLGSPERTLKEALTRCRHHRNQLLPHHRPLDLVGHLQRNSASVHA